MFSLICVWINGWVSNREAGDLRRYRAHYDVIVMCLTTQGVNASAVVIWDYYTVVSVIINDLVFPDYSCFSTISFKTSLWNRIYIAGILHIAVCGTGSTKQFVLNRRRLSYKIRGIDDEIIIYPNIPCDYGNQQRFGVDTIQKNKHLYIYICSTARCRYNAVQYNAIFHTALQLLRHYTNQNLYLQNLPIPCPNGRVMGCLFLGFRLNEPR